jgi:hypothetical protein
LARRLLKSFNTAQHNSHLLQEALHVIMAASHKEMKHASPGPENQARLQSSATFKIVASEAPNSEAGMKMWLAKTGLDRINHPGDFATPRLGESAHVFAKLR